VLGEAVNGPRFRVVAAVCVAAVAGMALLVLFQTVGAWTGVAS
jgi:hypothetical protein